MNADLSTEAPAGLERDVPVPLAAAGATLDADGSHEELAGRLSADERRIGDADAEPPSQDELDGEIATMLLTNVLYPEDYLVVASHRLGGPPQPERENAYVNLRTALGTALKVATPGNRERALEAVYAVLRMALRDDASARIAREHDRRDFNCHGCGAEVPSGIGTCQACRFAYAQGEM